MIALPVQINENEMDVYVILQPENLDRIKAYDPAEIVRSRLGEGWKDMAIRNVVLMFATAADIATIAPLFEAGNLLAALRYLARGWHYRPESGGDYDTISYDSLLNRLQ
jgi:hypothetical protein